MDYITGAKDKGITSEEIQKVHQICIQDGKCLLCQKHCYDTPDDTHKLSKADLEKVHEQALCDSLLGESKLFR